MKHVFVEHIPEQLEEGVLYVSLEYDTVVHSCACGCGNEVVTPLSPAEWSVNYDGRSISLSPSIGNWGFACRSHYWIRRGNVEWAAKWSNDKIRAVREKDREDREMVYEGNSSKAVAAETAKPTVEAKTEPSLISRVLRWFR